MYINDFPDGLISIAKLFADDPSIFFIVQDPNESAKYLNLDLSVISQWAYQRKMVFDPDPKKTALETIFYRKKYEGTHPGVFYKNIEVFSRDSQKHLA